MNRGDVWWAELPGVGRRPVSVLTRNQAIDVLTAVTVAPVTRTVRGIPTEVTLDDTDGMPGECAVTLDNVQTVPKSVLTERITQLGPDRLAELCTALAIATGCDR